MWWMMRRVTQRVEIMQLVIAAVLIRDLIFCE